MGSTHYARQTIKVSRSAAIAHLLSRNWRKNDPPRKTVDDLDPGDFHKRVVIRSGEFIGTVCGVLLDTHPHPSLVHFTCVQLYGNKLLTFRDDVEVIVLSGLHSGR